MSSIKAGWLVAGVLACGAALSAALAGGARAEEPAVKPEIQKLLDDAVGGKGQARWRALDELGALVEHAKEAAPVLRASLQADDEEVRWRAARSLGALGAHAEAAGPALVKALADENDKVRAYAAFALGGIGGGKSGAAPSSELLDALVKASVDRSPLVRRAAVGALRKIKAPREVVVPLVKRVLKESDPALVVAALHTVIEAGAEVVPLLCELMDDEHTCHWACVAAAELGPQAKVMTPHLAKALEHKDPETRLQAALALAEIGADAKAAVPDLARRLESDEFGGVRYAAAYALGRVGDLAGAKAALTKASQAEDGFLRFVAAQALANLAPEDEAAVKLASELIAAGLKSEQASLRLAAARALVEFKSRLPITAEQMVAALRDAQPEVIANAVNALVAQGGKAVPRVTRGLANKELRHLAVAVLQRIGPEAKEAGPALVEALKATKPETSDDARFVAELQFALGVTEAKTPEALPLLIANLASDNTDIRNSATFALGKFGPDAAGAAAALRANLRTEDEFQRLTTMWALLKIEPGNQELAARAVPALTKALDAPGEIARAESARMLGEIGAAAKSAAPKLKKLLEDSSPIVRQAAEQALKQLEP